MQTLWRAVFSLFLGGMFVSPALAEEELKRLMDRLLAPPAIRVEAGFTASVLVPPGYLYDPLFMLPRGQGVWINDDGGEEGEKGSRILSIDEKGAVSVLASLGKLVPVTGFDVAPPSFGQYGGQIFTLAQAKVGAEGATANHIIQRVDPRQGYTASVFCTLPTAGNVNQGISGAGVEARFGPEGSPFAGKFYAVTAYNNTIHQVTADGQCSPFLTFDAERWGSPFSLVFSLDGKTMLEALRKPDLAKSLIWWTVGPYFSGEGGRALGDGRTGSETVSLGSDGRAMGDLGPADSTPANPPWRAPAQSGPAGSGQYAA